MHVLTSVDGAALTELGEPKDKEDHGKSKKYTCTFKKLMFCNLLIVGACSPKKKKCKIEKDRRSKGEKMMEKAMESFNKYQNEAEEKFRKWEEERWNKETKLEEKRH